MWKSRYNEGMACAKKEPLTPCGRSARALYQIALEAHGVKQAHRMAVDALMAGDLQDLTLAQIKQKAMDDI